MERTGAIGVEQMTDKKPKDAHKWLFEDADVLNLTMKIPNFSDRVAMRKIILKAEQQGFEQGKLAGFKEGAELVLELNKNKATIMEIVEKIRLKSQIKEAKK